MLHEATTSHILSLPDADLLRYVLTGRRVYEAEAIAFAQRELDRREIPPEQLAKLRPRILADLAAMDAVAAPDPTRPEAPAAVVCQRCGVEAPIAYREFLQNIGMVSMRRSTTYSGVLCRRCSDRICLKASAITFFLGWWGMTSAWVTPAYLLHNLMQYVAGLRVKRAPKHASPPVIDEALLKKIAPHLDEMTSRILAGDEAAAIARNVAEKSGLTPGQVWCYLQTMAKKSDKYPAEN